MVYRLEHSAMFPAEKTATVESYLKGIKRELILRTGSYLSAFDKKNPAVRDNFTVLSKWFNAENNGFANDIYKELKRLDKKENRETIILNIYTTLKLLEKGFHQKDDENLTNTEIEKRIFKAYLLLNEIDNNKDNDIFKSLEDQEKDIKWPLLVFTQTFRYADISNYSLREVYSEQLVKATQFFKFLEKKYPNELKYFVSHYDCSTWQEFIQKLFPLLRICANSKEGFTEINVNEGELMKRDIDFIDKFAFSDETEELKDLDFVSLRSKPLIKVSEKSYRVIYDLFVFEKVFNGIFFTLRNMPGMNLDKLKNIFTFQFSEKTLLYYVLKNIYSYQIRQFSGEELDNKKIKGAPDYYIRKRNKILLFESKDVVLNSVIKESTSFKAYEAEIQKKLYFEEKDGVIKQKAIIQLINNITEILKGSIKYDKVKKGLKIYPIIVVHHRQLNVAGLNQLLNVWFKKELKKLEAQNLDTKRVAPLTVINISTLIFYADYFALKKYSIEKMIDRYHRASRLDNIKAKDREDLERQLLRSVYPFSMFISNQIKRKGKDSLLNKNIRFMVGKV